ncbi:hypothetical protein LY78DRAFT_160006 [Colletotrichum sublineola]|nr:hypothetical protein LY78DRAFT_160006 [Colletotrichum sublineola]
MESREAVYCLVPTPLTVVSFEFARQDKELLSDRPQSESVAILRTVRLNDHPTLSHTTQFAAMGTQCGRRIGFGGYFSQPSCTGNPPAAHILMLCSAFRRCTFSEVLDVFDVSVVFSTLWLSGNGRALQWIPIKLGFKDRKLGACLDRFGASPLLIPGLSRVRLKSERRYFIPNKLTVYCFSISPIPAEPWPLAVNSVSILLRRGGLISD